MKLGAKPVERVTVRAAKAIDGLPVVSDHDNAPRGAGGGERQLRGVHVLYCNGKRQSEEETNIHYVALTRAKDTLILVSDREGV